jgi:hypothetical protein
VIVTDAQRRGRTAQGDSVTLTDRRRSRDKTESPRLVRTLVVSPASGDLRVSRRTQGLALLSCSRVPDGSEA